MSLSCMHQSHLFGGGGVMEYLKNRLDGIKKSLRTTSLNKAVSEEIKS